MQHAECGAFDRPRWALRCSACIVVIAASGVSVLLDEMAVSKLDYEDERIQAGSQILLTSFFLLFSCKEPRLQKSSSLSTRP